MVVATSSRARLHDLACLGRVRRAQAGGAGLHPARASCRQSVTDATSIGDGPPPGPRATSSRPETDDLVASTIWSAPSVGRRLGRGLPAARDEPVEQVDDGVDDATAEAEED